MKKNTLIAFGVVAMSVSAGTLAAPITDVQEYSNNTATEYFVDSDANKYDSPYYRGANQDWGWTHNAIAGSFSSIVLEISAFDVDALCGSGQCEEDMISIWDGASWVGFGNLDGEVHRFPLEGPFQDRLDLLPNLGLELLIAGPMPAVTEHPIRSGFRSRRPSHRGRTVQSGCSRTREAAACCD